MQESFGQVQTLKPKAIHSLPMSLRKLQLKDVDVKDKRVLIRVDFNVPQDKKDPSIITNTARSAAPPLAPAARACAYVLLLPLTRAAPDSPS